MSQTQTVTITDEEKKQIQGFYEIFKANPKAITQEQRTIAAAINDKAWIVKKDDSIPFEKRIEAYEIIKIIHTMLGRKFDESYKPREKGNGGGTVIATKEQREKNCKEFIAFLTPTLWESLTPFERAMALGNVWGSFKA